MKRVALIVTGKTEIALRQSLQQVFPDVEFVVRGPWDGFTSMELPETPMLNALGTAKRRTNIEKLVGLLISEVEPGRRDQKPPDLVVLIDDLELHNVDWPERAIEHVRTAVQAYVDTYAWSSANSRNRAIDRLRERCSFHLLCPMVEAYFYAEAEALARAGAKRSSMFDASMVDAEQFRIEDTDFSSPANRLSKDSLPVWAIPNRDRHPKSYLQFLCDPGGESLRPYLEVANEHGRPSGQNALRTLDWSKVLTPQQHVQFVRSLIYDIADALDEPAVQQRFAGYTHASTWPPRAEKVLRNI